ncbi:MAG: pyridoxamine 5'-phosphate oxidase [Nitrospinota bacterium]
MERASDLVTALREAPLGPESVEADPLRQFRRWYGEAARAGVLQPDAMHLATAGQDGKPSGRMVLYKDPGEHGLAVQGFPFFTNLGSPKARQIKENPEAALTFHWALLGRQVRIAGRVHRLPAEVSDRYFATRPEGSQLGAWASPQSEEAGSREALLARVEQFRREFAAKPIPRPPDWGGFWLEPREMEFWQHRDDRLHDRVLYLLARPAGGGGWSRRRLAP